MIQTLKTIKFKLDLINKYIRALFGIFFRNEDVDFKLISHFIKAAQLTLPFANTTTEVKELREHLAYCGKLINKINKEEFEFYKSNKRSRHLNPQGADQSVKLKADLKAVIEKYKQL